MRKEKICGLIPAAGYSSRMGKIKPLLKLNGSNILEKTTESLLNAGISDIFVVLGCYYKEIMADYKYAGDVHIIYNEHFDRGMFSSVRAGVQAALAEHAYDAFLMLPADCPMVNPDTVRKIADHYLQEGALILQPSYNGRCGHPCLISMELAGQILSEDFPEGLRTLIAQNIEKRYKLPVSDDGILIDVDTADMYQKLQEGLPFPRK